MKWKDLQDEARDNWLRVRAIVNALGYNVPPDGITIAMASRKPTPKQRHAQRATAKQNQRATDGLPQQGRLLDKTGQPIKSTKNKGFQPTNYKHPNRISSHWQKIQTFQANLMVLPIWSDEYGVPFRPMVEAIITGLRKAYAVRPSTKELGFAVTHLQGEAAERVVRRYAARNGNGIRGSKRRANHDQCERILLGTAMNALPTGLQETDINPLTMIWSGATVGSEDVQNYSDQAEAAFEILLEQAATVRRFRVIGGQ